MFEFSLECMNWASDVKNMQSYSVENSHLISSVVSNMQSYVTGAVILKLSILRIEKNMDFGIYN